MGRVVYQTGIGRTCPDCSEPIDQCRCRAEQTVSFSDGVVRLSLDRKGRKGKGMTLVSGLGLKGNELKKLAKEMKARCAVGGAIKEGVVEIQGDQREALKAFLETKGYAVKFSGG
jgi:translation initiation factor 1